MLPAVSGRNICIMQYRCVLFIRNRIYFLYVIKTVAINRPSTCYYIYGTGVFFFCQNVAPIERKCKTHTWNGFELQFMIYNLSELSKSDTASTLTGTKHGTLKKWVN